MASTKILRGTRKERAWLKQAIGMLGRVDSVLEAATRLKVGERTLRERFAKAGLARPGEYLPRPGVDLKSPTSREERLRKFAELTQGGISLEELCDALDCSPTKARKLIDEARGAGLDVHIDGDAIGRTPIVTPAPINVVEASEGWHVVGVISDTHLGSRYCLRDQLRDFVDAAYESGVREILHPGDIIDGCYRHGRWEVTHPSCDDQIADLLETLPARPGLSYHAIGGNHDETFRSEAGFDVGRMIEARFQDAGRNDFHFYGWRSAMLRLHGALFQLHHPRGSGSYAKSYQVQKFLRDSYGPYKPDILLVGHYHTFNYCVERGVHAVMCPTFQGGGSSFSRSLGGTPAIGGLVISWRTTADSTIRDFNLSVRSYYENEGPRELQGVPGESVERADYEPIARRHE